MKTIQYSKLFLGLVFLASMVSCVRFERDPSPDNTGGISNLPKNAKVVSVDVLEGHFPGDFDSVTQTEAGEDYYLLLEVLGNDVSGNIYKSMYVRDASNPEAKPEDTRALNLAIDKTNLYNFFPIGQKFYLKCTGLYIGRYKGLPQMGFRYKNDNEAVSLGRIPDEVFMQNAIRYCMAPVDPAHMPKPIVIDSAEQLNDPKLYNQLVLLRNVEFSPDDIGQEFAPAPPTGSNPIPSDRIFTINGTGSSLTLRTSSACRFFRRPVPAGKGDMLCIYAIYGTTQQFYLRELSDLNLAQFDSTANSSSVKVIFWQSFAKGFGNFTAYDAKGSASWEVGVKGDDKNYVQVSAYQSGKNEDWLYSPEIELPQAEEYSSISLSFEQAIAFQENPPKDNYTIRISEKFSGTGNPQEVDDWNILTIPNPHPGASGGSFTFMNTGDINLNAYAGKKVRVAFLYKNSDGKEPTWEIRKLKIVANK